MKKMVGKGNVGDILIDGVTAKALIDTGSQISTISEAFLKHLKPEPKIRDLDELDLEVKCADGSPLQYIGYVAVHVSSLFVEESQDEDHFYPLLVVPATEYNKSVPIIAGTNIIARLKQRTLGAVDVPNAWDLAFSSLTSNSVGVVKSTVKVTLQPMEVRTVLGLVRKGQSIESAITEQIEGGSLPKVAVCPRIVKLDNPGKTSRVPVRLCNITARVITIPPKANLCDLQEVKVLRSPSVAKKTDSKLETVNVNQQCVGDTECSIPPGLDLDDSVLTQEQKKQVRQFLTKWDGIFSKGPTDLGCAKLVEHEIHLENDRPFKEPYRRIPPALIQEVREHLNEMMEIGAIRPSKSPFSSNVVIVRKKDGSIRFCIDYRKLNQRTIKDAQAIPRVDDTLHLLAGSKYFSTLDLKSGYWQVELKEKDKAKTAFQVGTLGFHECNRMPFGLCNAPATFQRLMERCMGELNLRDCLIYLDDIIIFSSTFEEHVERLQAVFERLQENNLKLKPS